MESLETSSLTKTQQEQLGVEQMVVDMFRVLHDLPPHARSLMLEVWHDRHIEYLTRGLKHLGPTFHVLDANRPWICYYILHSISLLGDALECDIANNVVDFLNRCQDKDGGYGGGPGQMPHLATTYAAVNCLITLGGHMALTSINREQLYHFLLRLKEDSGAFRMHEEGEIDVRACYTAVSVASALNILDHELVRHVGDYILSCQTYEGGIAGEPGSEAHGGYTFCGLATMILINEIDRLDLPSLIEWVVFRQGVEGGFQGRTNKLVDGCYSFWQGAVLALVQRLSPYVEEQLKLLSAKRKRTSEDSSLVESGLYQTSYLCNKDSHAGHGELSGVGLSFLNARVERNPLFCSLALQKYILTCCQVMEGGFRDKPEKARDFYHTCYCLSGLSLCQYILSKFSGDSPLQQDVLGPYSNLLEPIHPLFNVVVDQFHEAHDYFHGAPYTRFD